MNNTVIKVENLSKQYRLGLVSTGTLHDDLTRWWASVRGKEDPFLKVGDINKREVKGESDYIWALRDINFEVAQGEVLGIIGKNGAGKSTLLKILSQVTHPTAGSVKMKGKIASLLEVGTGFHPDLTGRENIFLNGAIMGMTKTEIKSKFDEIVDFSGVERYIDTPVKRYSSGMYVRLAFAVAAHLDPDILIVDEVLAVGDAEFQKKCLGKMQDVSQKEGRTVLFVSHNLASIESLCTRSICLNKGLITKMGNTNEVISHYLTPANREHSANLETRTDRTGTGDVRVTKVVLRNSMNAETNIIGTGEQFSFDVYYKGKQNNSYVAIVIGTDFIDNIIQAHSFYSIDNMPNLSSGKFTCFFNENILLAGEYIVAVHIGTYDTPVDSILECLRFEVMTKDIYKTGRPPISCGLVYSKHQWKFD